jgi:phosphatidylglycerophosphate synthase
MNARRFADRLLGGFVRFLHEGLRLSPTHVSILCLALSLAAAILIATRQLGFGLAVMALAQILDGVDGAIARRYNLTSSRGERIDMIADRLSECAIFGALAYAGYAGFTIAILAYVAIILVTALEPMSRFDPGFKRFVLYFGYMAGLVFGARGMDLALQVIFFANLSVFALGTVMVDYRLQRQIDNEAIKRRAHDRQHGIDSGPADPPSFLSKLAERLT